MPRLSAVGISDLQAGEDVKPIGLGGADMVAMRAPRAAQVWAWNRPSAGGPAPFQARSGAWGGRWLELDLGIGSSVLGVGVGLLEGQSWVRAARAIRS